MTLAGRAAAPALAVLHRLTARDFRNFDTLDLGLDPRGAVLIGENGQGKTNLLEAIAYLQLLRSMRGVRDVDLVRFGAEAFHVHADFSRDGERTADVGFQRADRRKRVRMDGVVPERLSDALGMLPSVTFSPADLELVAGAPAARRRYLDILLALTSPHAGYLTALQRYRGALARRNAAMRDGGRGSRAAHTAAAVAAWEPALADAGAVLLARRVEWVRQMAPRFTALCAAIGESADVRMRYQSSLALPEDGASDDVEMLRGLLLAALEQRRDVDMRRGLTHAGPHRDDVIITMSGETVGAGARELRVFGSAGQQRTAAIALRLLEAETFRDRLHLVPVMLLDDPFAELDHRRSARILALLQGSGGSAGLGQTILAVPRASDIPAELTDLPRLRVVRGCVSPESMSALPALPPLAARAGGA